MAEGPVGDTVQADPGSYRDPRGQVHSRDGRVLRTVTPVGHDDFRAVEASGLFERLIERDMLVGYQVLDAAAEGFDAADVSLVLEHPTLPFISYPYEWSFGLLKSAALLQLDVYLEALRHGVTLSDASAYNVQFIGSRPVFIDHLSFRPYRESEFWVAHRQFCEQFLNPLVLRAKLGITHNAWYRGSLEGISTVELNKLVPIGKKLGWNMFSQVTLQARFQSATVNRSSQESVSLEKGLPKSGFENLLKSLRHWIETLEPLKEGKSVWGDYANDNSYSDTAAAGKRAFVEQFVRRVEPGQLWDIGCNTGEYSEAALRAGAAHVIGFDFDQLAIDGALRRSVDRSLSFLPLFLDASNPAPSQGWAQAERRGLAARAGADAVLALALVHHLAIARNVPLDSLLDWLLSLAEHGVVEFVPKSDPMVQELLRFREDIFPHYTESSFLEVLGERAEIVSTERVVDSERLMIAYRRS